MAHLLFEVVYFLLPVYFSNMGAVVSARVWKRWKTPVIPDKFTFRGKPIIGKNKTWRGLIVGTLLGMLVYLIQARNITGLEIHDYSSITLGFLLAFGAVFGDMLESFVKRQMNIAPGAKFIPWDQIDHPFMGMLLALFIVKFSWIFFLTGLVVTFFLHVVINFISFTIKMRDTLW